MQISAETCLFLFSEETIIEISSSPDKDTRVATLPEKEDARGTM